MDRADKDMKTEVHRQADTQQGGRQIYTTALKF